MYKFLLSGILILTAAQPILAATSSPAHDTVPARTKDDKAENAKILHLITYIRSLDGATFIRNGNKHSCREAAEHLEAKWKKHSDKIRSANEFIEQLASHSGMSGEAYKIQFPDGTTKPSGEILLQELQRLEGKP